MEAANIQAKCFDWDRETITFEITKQRVAKKNKYAVGSSRTFKVSHKYLSFMRKYIKSNEFKPEDYIFLDNSTIPENYLTLNNFDKKKYYEKVVSKFYQLLQRKLEKCGVKNYKEISLHNIRKTYGDWMRIFDIQLAELCYRMGHDIKTYMAHYGSSLIFNPDERRWITNFYGDTL